MIVKASKLVKQQAEDKLDFEESQHRIRSQMTLARNAASQRVLQSLDIHNSSESPLRENKGYMNSMAILRGSKDALARSGP